MNQNKSNQIKRVFTPFRETYECDYTQEVKDDYQYILKALKHPREYPLEYSDAVYVHLSRAIREMKEFETQPEDIEDVKIRKETTLKLINRFKGTDLEPYNQYLIRDSIMSYCAQLDEVDEFFYWHKEVCKKGELSIFFLYDDAFLSYKFIHNRPIEKGEELLSPFSKSSLKITKFARDRFDEFVDVFNSLFQEKGSPYILDELFKGRDFKQYDCTYRCFKGSYNYSLATYADEIYCNYVMQLCRESENLLRGKYGLKGVGEEWVTETELFYKIKTYYSTKNIYHNFRSKWLGQQHIDIFIEDEKIAIEVQGEQHYKSVSFFGGTKGLKNNKIRDKHKALKCKENDVVLIYVYEKYSFSELTSLINKIVIDKNRKKFIGRIITLGEKL